MKLDLSIIVVHWNTPDLLFRQLDYLLKCKADKIIVIDNNSTPALERVQLDKYKNIQWILNSKNMGFSAACNQGKAISHTKWLLFLNSDVFIKDAEYLSSMIKFAQEKYLDALSPLPSISQINKYAKNLPSPLNLLIEYSPLNRILPQKHAIKSLTGGALLIRRNVLNSIGGWDEDFFIWFEDCDLTQRLIKSGYKVGWFPNTVNHIGGGSVNKLSLNERKQVYFKSMQIYANKHFSLLGQYVVKFIAMINYC